MGICCGQKIVMKIEEFTIILITVNPAKIERWVSFHQDFNYLIVDGSERGLFNLEGIKNYLHMPHAGYFQRLSAGLSEVETKFVMIGGDDEFVYLKSTNVQLQDEQLNDVVALIPKTRVYRGPLFGFWQEMYTTPCKKIQELFGSKNESDRLSEDVLSFMLNHEFNNWYSFLNSEFLKKKLAEFNLTDEDFIVFESVLLPWCLSEGSVKFSNKFTIDRIKKKKVEWNFGNIIEDVRKIKRMPLVSDAQLIALMCLLKTNMTLISIRPWRAELSKRIKSKLISLSSSFFPYNFLKK